MTAPNPEQLVVAICAPLEPELVEQIRSGSPEVTVLYEPELLPPERFPADHSGDPDFQRSAEQQERYWANIRRADVLYGLPDESPAGLARAVRENPRLRWVHAMAAGAGGSVRAAELTPEELARVTVTTSAGVHALPLAEFALMGLLNGFKRVAELQADQRAQRWPTPRVPTRLLSGSRLVIAGLGEIGVETARLAKALGMSVSGSKREVTPITGIDSVVPNSGLPGLVSEADAVVSTLPGTPYTEHLFDAEMFSHFKPGTVFVNVGRGSVVDEAALLSALDDGTVSYACLDVFEQEPLPGSSPLWKHPRVLVSPHTSALSLAENRLIAERFSSNLALFRAGKTMPHAVDPVYFY
ncbi:phosphoglycerate dehydrogenase-like enzyme [Psychromicrobium silvestre]|uniref:Phosphoglycerate dehydrogenase-like enzyme n=1 Tax=Psychromicrobium silvestre TaxID=1645614 RepID=A0A7Y9LU71_9MICC|nr:D-2-hydroxyacid dehydrogenase [Psychromicrobium silvestre]NYE95667.1 phosphoglycerate dehydrogenase-like enzyme [Psychromicrobium silvestre]